MIKQLQYLEINYTEKDLDYINDIGKYLDEIANEIVNFFDIKDFGEKIKVYLYGNLEEFRKDYIKISNELYGISECEDWLCGFAPDDKNIYTLCLEEYQKTKGHENEDVLSLIHLIMHEFTHSVYHKFTSVKCGYHWLGEGIACVLSHQYDKYEYKKIFDATLEQICKGNISYNYYSTMFVYVLDTYGKDYILRLISDNDFLVSETPKLYDEVKNYYDNKKNKS